MTDDDERERAGMRAFMAAREAENRAKRRDPWTPTQVFIAVGLVLCCAGLGMADSLRDGSLQQPAPAEQPAQPAPAVPVSQPVPCAYARITNDYAESLFWLDFTVAGETTHAAKEIRLVSGQSHDVPIGCEEIEGKPITFALSAMSMGDRMWAPKLKDTVHIGMVYVIMYRYDLARGSFQLQHGWEYR